VTSLKGANYAYRAEVVAALNDAGLLTAAAAPEAKGREGEQRRCGGDIVGVLGWTVAVRNQRDLALSEAADEVAREAQAEGSNLYVSIQHRTGHPVASSYCTMPLSVLLNLLPRASEAPGQV
jgi:hypothetical protein